MTPRELAEHWYEGHPKNEEYEIRVNGLTRLIEENFIPKTEYERVIYDLNMADAIIANLEERQ